MATSAKRPPARTRILETASTLFAAHGIRNIGIDRVIAESEVAKATLYAHFPSKDELVAEYLRLADQSWRAKLRAAAAAAGEDPRDQLVGLFDAVTDAFVRHGFHGCPFIKSATECDPGSPGFEVTVAHKVALRSWVRGLAVAVGVADPDALAHQLTMLIDGTLTAGRLEQDRAAPDSAKLAAQVLVHAAC